MKFAKTIIFNVLFALLLSVGVSAANKYIADDAKVLKQDTITTMEQNLGKIQENTEVTVKFDIINSLNGKSIDEYAKQYAKDNISGDQYLLFVSSIGDKKNKLLVGEKANNILSKSDIEEIVSLPNQDFKSSNYDSGIMKVGKSLDEKVTAKAIKTGKATVSNNGYSTTVEHKTNYLKIFLIVLVIIGIGIVVFLLVRRKINNDYEKRKKEFAAANNLDSYIEDDDTFHSADVTKKDTSAFSRGGSSTSSTSTCHSEGIERNRTTYSDATSRTYSEQTRTSGNSTVNNTTVINNNNDDKFVEGMMMGTMLSNATNHNHYEEHDYHHERHDYDDSGNSHSSYNSYKSPEKSIEEDENIPTVTSGNWGNDSSVSSWGNNSNNDDEKTPIDSYEPSSDGDNDTNTTSDWNED